MRNYPGVRKNFFLKKKEDTEVEEEDREGVGECLNKSPKMRGEKDG